MAAFGKLQYSIPGREQQLRPKPLMMYIFRLERKLILTAVKLITSAIFTF